MTYTAASLAKTTINRTTSNSTVELDKYFKTIKANLHITTELCDYGVFDATNYEQINTLFIPSFNNIPQLNSIVVADTSGNQYSIIREDSTWLNSVVYKSQDSGMVISLHRWKGNVLNQTTIKKWTEFYSTYDPRKRPWYIGAINTETPDKIWWTQPYLFYTLQVPGITISLKSKNKLTQKTHIIEYDILISHISEFTTQSNISKNGKLFILSNDYKVIGLPNEKYITDIDSIKKYILQDYNNVHSKTLEVAIDKWLTLSDNYSEPFTIKVDGKKWWARITKYELGKNNNFIIGVVVPEKDFLAEIHKTRNIVFGGFMIIIIFVIIVIQQYVVKRKSNILLATQKKQITDSIVYAERIQRALFPRKKDLDTFLGEYFIFYKPLHIVSGDFYWIKKIKTLKTNFIVVAVADCTGHGVPGAFMSMLGISFLNEIVLHENILQPNDILKELRNFVKYSLKQTGKENESKDGMDIAIYTINTEKNTLEFSGAYNPLYIIRDSKLIEIKPDRQPIAIYVKEKDFTNHKFQLQKNDCLYTFSDGFMDQFGGKNDEKFMKKRFKELIRTIAHKPMQEQKNILNQTYTDWKKNREQIDDVLVIGVKIK